MKRKFITTHMLRGAKRENCTILYRAWTMAIDSGVPNYLWTETVNTSTYLTNKSPSRLDNGFSLEHVYTWVLPNLKHLKILGCLIYAHVGKKQKWKMGSKSIRCIFTGYNESSKA
jgi:hypothetical protein